MEEILQQINAVPGVIGSLVCRGEGEIIARVFPPLFDSSILQGVASTVADPAGGVRSAAGALDLVDLRYNDGRIVVKPLDEAYLLLLCTKAINIQVLTISLNVAKGKLDALLRVRPHGTGAAADSAPSTVREEPAVPTDVLVLPACRIDDANKGSSFEQFGMAALTKETARQISAYYGTGAFKKLKLTGRESGTTGVFAVMVVNENDPFYDGRIILCKSIERKLQAGPGDLLTVELP